jgi:hypothetical protein
MPDSPYLDIPQPDGNVVNCTVHNMGDCPYHDKPTPQAWRPGPRLPSAQYTVTLAVTGDDIGMDALGAVIPPILTSTLGMSSVHVTEIRPGYPAEPPQVAAPQRPDSDEVFVVSGKVATMRPGVDQNTARNVIEALIAVGWYPGGNRSAAQPGGFPAVRVHIGHDRTVIVYLDGEELASGNYDEYGWAGLDMIRNLAARIAQAAGLTLVRCEGPSREGYCDDGGHDV